MNIIKKRYLIEATKKLEPCFSDFQEEQNSKSYVDEEKAKIRRKNANELEISHFFVTVLQN